MCHICDRWTCSFHRSVTAWRMTDPYKVCLCCDDSESDNELVPSCDGCCECTAAGQSVGHELPIRKRTRFVGNTVLTLWSRTASWRRRYCRGTKDALPVLDDRSRSPPRGCHLILLTPGFALLVYLLMFWYSLFARTWPTRPIDVEAVSNGLFEASTAGAAMGASGGGRSGGVISPSRCLVTPALHLLFSWISRPRSRRGGLAGGCPRSPRAWSL